MSKIAAKIFGGIGGVMWMVAAAIGTKTGQYPFQWADYSQEALLSSILSWLGLFHIIIALLLFMFITEDKQKIK